MRIMEFDRRGNELKEFPKHIRNSGVITQYLSDRGWKKTGFEGHYSTVYTNPNYQYVLKVNYNYDRAYAYYVFLIHKFPNKHFPIISNVKLITTGHGIKIYLYSIEKLYKLKDSDFINNYNEIENLLFAMRSTTQDYQVIYDQHPEVHYYLEKNPEMWEALKTMAKYGKGVLDFTLNNVMQRKDGTVVITDPFSQGDIR